MKTTLIISNAMPWKRKVRFGTSDGKMKFEDCHSIKIIEALRHVST